MINVVCSIYSWPKLDQGNPHRNLGEVREISGISISVIQYHES